MVLGIRRIAATLGVLYGLGALPASVPADQVVVRWSVSGGGFGITRVGAQLMGGTVGQPVAGLASAGSFALNSGFWLPIASFPVGVEDSLPQLPAAPPAVSFIRAAAPNPVYARTRLEFALATAGPVEIRVFDVSGALVRTLQEGWYPAGRYSLEWHTNDAGGRPVRPGMYIVHTRIPGRARTQKVVVLR